MKTLVKRIAVVTCITLSGMFAHAQLPPAGAPPRGPAGPGAPAPRAEALQTLTTITGTLTAYTANDRGAYNGFSLQSNSQAIAVRFPEHMGAQLMAAAKKGSTISITGFYEPGPDGVNAFHLMTATSGSTQIGDTPPAPPVQDTAMTPRIFSGTISSLRRNLEGLVNGVILDSKQVIELPPPATDQLQALLVNGEKIQITGFAVVPPAGVVMAQEMTTVRPQTITIKGQTYMVR